MARFKKIVSFVLIMAVMITGSMAMASQTVSAAEQQVASTSAVTKVTTKTTNKSVKMKSKAKVSKVTTKITTKKSSKVISKTSEKKVKQDKTVKTTVKTTFKKNSRTKYIKTTVKTTTKTTTTKYKKETIASIRKAVPKDALNAFDQLGFTIKINGKLDTDGVFSTKSHMIQLKTAKTGVLLHEMGHFISCLKGKAADSQEFKAIYKAEKNKYTGSNKKYVTSTDDEYYAESYRDYIERPATLKKERPRTYTYMKNNAHNITQAEIDAMRELYGSKW